MPIIYSDSIYPEMASELPPPGQSMGGYFSKRAANWKDRQWPGQEKFDPRGGNRMDQHFQSKYGNVFTGFDAAPDGFDASGIKTLHNDPWRKHPSAPSGQEWRSKADKARGVIATGDPTLTTYYPAESANMSALERRALEQVAMNDLAMQDPLAAKAEFLRLNAMDAPDAAFDAGKLNTLKSQMKKAPELGGFRNAPTGYGNWATKMGLKALGPLALFGAMSDPANAATEMAMMGSASGLNENEPAAGTWPPAQPVGNDRGQWEQYYQQYYQ